MPTRIGGSGGSSKGTKADQMVVLQNRVTKFTVNDVILSNGATPAAELDVAYGIALDEACDFVSLRLVSIKDTTDGDSDYLVICGNPLIDDGSIAISNSLTLAGDGIESGESKLDMRISPKSLVLRVRAFNKEGAAYDGGGGGTPEPAVVEVVQYFEAGGAY